MSAGVRAIGEEHLVELRGAGDLRDRAQLHTGLVDRAEDEADALVLLLAAGVGAAHHEDPVGDVPEAGPDLLTVDHPLVTVTHRRGLHVGEVGAGVGLAETLTPVLVGAEDRREEAVLLLIGAEHHQGRAEQLLAEEPGAARTAGAGVLLVEDHLLRQRQIAAAVLLRPADPHPAARGQLALPGAAHLQFVPLTEVVAAAERGELAHQVLGQPCADLAAKCLVLGRESELHAPIVLGI